jgi:hypothetical protein
MDANEIRSGEVGVKYQEAPVSRQEKTSPVARRHDGVNRSPGFTGNKSGLSAGDVWSLQRSVGNQAVCQLVAPTKSSAPLQRKTNGTQKVQNPSTGQTNNTPLADPVGALVSAVASSDFGLMKSLQQRLLKEMKTNPMNPPPLVRQALATGRHMQMERVHLIRNMLLAAIPKHTTPSPGEEGKEAELFAVQETIEKFTDEQCSPWLDVLMAGHAEYRYEHFDHAVQDSVLAAVQLHSALRGLGKIGHRAAAEKEARGVSNLPTGAWCGAFAYTQAKLSGGLGSQTRAAMQGVTGIEMAMAYKDDPYEKKPGWIWAFDHWMTIAAYHAARGSLRQYIKVGNGAPPEIRPGDIVIIDNEGADSGDHITTAISSDGDNLHTVGGNQGSDSAWDEKGVSDNRKKLSKNPAAKNVSKAGVQRTEKPDRVFAVGRWSIVDYEQHVYHYSVKEPPAPSAGEIKAIAAAVGATG